MTDTTTVSGEGAAPPPPAVVVERVESLEDSMFQTLLEGNSTTSTEHADGLTLVATTLDVAMVEAAGGALTVQAEVDGGEAAATVPASLFDNVEADGVVLMLTAFDSASAGSMGDSREGVELPVQVKAAANANLFTLSGHRLSVTGLVEPVKVVLPVNYSAGLQCVFWDEANERWSTEGVELASPADNGYVVCESLHLTLFAAILRGFANTFKCSHATLLRAESLRELGRGDWHKTPGAIVLWSVAATLLGLLALAACLDWRRWMQGRADDEHFLIPLKSTDAAQVRVQSSRSSKGKPRRGCMCLCLVGSSSLVADWCRNSAALRDALDEVASTWAEYFGEVRDFVEGLAEGLELSSCQAKGCSARIVTVINHLMCTTLAISARRQVAASLGISSDVSSLVMRDEDLFDVLLDYSMRDVDEDSGVSLKVLAREDAWGKLHSEVEAKLDGFMEASAHWSSLPGTVWRLFLYHTPFGACLVHDAFTSAKMRVLLFGVDIVGSLMLVTVFFAESGVPRKRFRSLDCEFDDPYEFFGRLLAIGTGSVVVSGIPAIILGALCTRGMKRLEYEGCPEWNRQLLVWRIQDRIIWLLALLYLGFCLFFISVFLANVDRQDQGGWLISGLISLVEDTIVIPLAVAVTVPLLSKACLSYMSFHKGVRKEELVNERHTQIKREGNMTLPVLRI